MRSSHPVLVVVLAMIGSSCINEPTVPPRTQESPTESASIPSTSPPSGSLVPKDIVFVYSAGGDIYGETRSGHRVVLADGRQDEVWPSLSRDGTELLYQLGSGPPGEIVHLDLQTQTKSRIGPGQYPSFSPDGRAAWVVNNATDEPHIIVGVLFSEPEAEIVPIARWDGPIQVSPPIAWDRDGEYIYYSAGWEETQELYQTNSRGDANPFPMKQEMGIDASGTHLVSPYVRADSSVHVFKACCRKAIEDEWENFELGKISFTEGGGVYETVIELDPRRFDQSFPSWYPQVVSLGRLWRDVQTGRWEPFPEPTWIVANAIDALLLSEGGDSFYLSETLIREYDYPTLDPGGVPETFEGWGSIR